MARKNILDAVVATNQSLSASFNSAPTLVPYLDNVAYQIDILTVNSVGTFKVQGSLDYAQTPDEVARAGNWIDLTLSGNPSVGGVNDDIIISLNQVPFKALRLVYTSSVAGTGTCSIRIFSKQLGG